MSGERRLPDGSIEPTWFHSDDPINLRQSFRQDYIMTNPDNDAWFYELKDEGHTHLSNGMPVYVSDISTPPSTPPSLHEFIYYEVSSSWWARFISYEPLQELAGKWFAIKAQYKYNRYITSLKVKEKLAECRHNTKR